MFALDTSGSMSHKDFGKMVAFVRDIIEGLRFGSASSESGSRVGLLTFSSDVEVIFHLDEYETKYDIINAFPPHFDAGGTNMELALRRMREMFTLEHGDRPAIRNIGVVVTDGKSREEQSTWREARQTRSAGIELQVVGIGRSVRQSELHGIGSCPAGPDGKNRNVFLAESFDRLGEIREQLVDVVCNSK